MTTNTVETYMVASDHYQPINPLDGSAVVKVLSGGTVYYADQPYVTATTNQGSIALNASHTFTTPAWLRSASLSSVSVTVTGPVDDTTLDATAVATAEAASDPVGSATAAQAAAIAAAEAASVLRDGTGMPVAVESRSSAVKTGPYTIQTTDSTVLGDVAGGAVAFTLPAATGSGRRHKPGILPAAGSVDSANLLSILTNGSDVIDGFNLPAPTFSSLVAAGGGSLDAATYYAVITACNELGETLGSTELSAVVSAALIAAPVISSVNSSTSGGSLPTGTQYNYTATYLNANGETVASATVSVTTGAGATNSNTVTLTQSPTAVGATSARVYRTQQSSLPQVLAGTISGAGTTLVDGTAWALVNAATSPDVNTTGSKLTATWQALPTAHFYRYYRGTAPGGETVRYGYLFGTSYVDQGLATSESFAPPANNSTLLSLGEPWSGAPFSDVELADAAAGVWKVI